MDVSVYTSSKAMQRNQKDRKRIDREGFIPLETRQTCVHGMFPFKNHPNVIYSSDFYLLKFQFDNQTNYKNYLLKLYGISYLANNLAN